MFRSRHLLRGEGWGAGGEQGELFLLKWLRTLLQCCFFYYHHFREALPETLIKKQTHFQYLSTQSFRWPGLNLIHKNTSLSVGRSFSERELSMLRSEPPLWDDVPFLYKRTKYMVRTINMMAFNVYFPNLKSNCFLERVTALWISSGAFPAWASKRLSAALSLACDPWLWPHQGLSPPCSITHWNREHGW